MITICNFAKAKRANFSQYNTLLIFYKQVVLANCTNLCVSSMKTRLQNLRFDLNPISPFQLLSSTFVLSLTFFLQKFAFYHVLMSLLFDM